MIPKAKYQKTRFRNGFTFVSEQVKGVSSLSLGIWAKVGTRQEERSEAGASHFLEHMLFKGTRKRNALQIAQEIDEVGGDFNAFTSRENTCFHVLLLQKDYKLGLDVLADVILNSEFKSEEVERERKVILQEIAMVEESPEEMVHDLFYENIFGTHGLGRPILGSEKSIKRMKRSEMMSFYLQNYRPDQLVLSVVGDVPHRMLEEKLGGLINRSWPARPLPHTVVPKLQQVPSFKKGRWWVSRPTEQVHLVWGVQGPHYSAPERYPVFVLNNFLGGGMSSSLFQEIREKRGLAYTVYSCLSPFRDTGIFSVYAATSPSKAKLCIELIEKCVRVTQSRLLTSKELKRVKENLKGSILLAADNVESRMLNLGKNEMFLDEYLSVEEVCKSIDAVTASEVKAAANSLFSKEKGTWIALGPRPPKSTLAKLQPTFYRLKSD